MALTHMTKIMPLTTRRSSTPGTLCVNGNYGSIRRICAADNQITYRSADWD